MDNDRHYFAIGYAEDIYEFVIQSIKQFMWITNKLVILYLIEPTFVKHAFEEGHSVSSIELLKEIRKINQLDG